MIKCYDCDKPITTKEFWRRYYNGNTEYYCNKCARSHVGGYGYDFGLMLTTKEEEGVKDE